MTRDASRSPELLPDFSSAERGRIRTRLLAWYDANREDLPWRRRPTAYTTWIAEAMLQQTQVATVIPYYRRFLKRLPSIKALAEAGDDTLTKLWEGLGYYNRVQNLRKAARRIREAFGGRFPRTFEDIVSLPGIGRYTAGAIASIALGQDVPVVDGNVIRVFARLLGDDGDVTRGPVKDRFWAVAERLLPRGRAGDFNQALMELGRVICRPKGPLCQECPVSAVCRAYRTGTQEALPVKAPRNRVPHYDVGVGVVWRDSRVLIARRPPTGFLAGLWEFPGGKRRDGEDIRECVRREVAEEVGLAVAVGPHMMTVKHAYSHFKVTLHFYTCEYGGGKPRPLAATALKWVRPDRISDYAFPAGSQRAVRAIAEFAAGRPLLGD